MGLSLGSFFPGFGGGGVSAFDSASQSSNATTNTDTSLYTDNGAISANVTGANAQFTVQTPPQLWPLMEAVVYGAYKTMGEVVGQVSEQANTQYKAATDLVDQQYNSLGALQQFVKNIAPLAIIGGCAWLYFRRK